MWDFHFPVLLQFACYITSMVMISLLLGCDKKKNALLLAFSSTPTKKFKSTRVERRNEARSDKFRVPLAAVAQVVQTKRIQEELSIAYRLNQVANTLNRELSIENVRMQEQLKRHQNEQRNDYTSRIANLEVHYQEREQMHSEELLEKEVEILRLKEQIEIIRTELAAENLRFQEEAMKLAQNRIDQCKKEYEEKLYQNEINLASKLHERGRELTKLRENLAYEECDVQNARFQHNIKWHEAQNKKQMKAAPQNFESRTSKLEEKEADLLRKAEIRSGKRWKRRN